MGLTPERKRTGFTLVELLVVIGIIAVLIGILLPVIGRARKQASTVACMANLRSAGQLIYLYAGDNRGSLPYGYYRSDVVAVNPDPNAVDEADLSTTQYVWWSVLRSYMRRNTAADNGASNSGKVLSSRGMKGLYCPDSLATERGVSYTVNMVAMPDRQFESHPFNASNTNPPSKFPIKPAIFKELYPDNILMWDCNEIPPSFGSQYVVGYEIDIQPSPYQYGTFINPKKAGFRYRDMAADPMVLSPTGSLGNEVPIYPGSNKEVNWGGSPGEIRWRHGNNDRANFLFTDGTVRTLKITTGTPGKSDCKGEALHKYFRIKSRAGMRPNG